MPLKSYPTDLTDKQWNVLEPLILTSKVGGRPRTVDMREILNAIFYILAVAVRGDDAHDLPWPTVYYYFRLWRIDGVWQKLNPLREKVRQRDGRESTPSAVIADSQSVKTTEAREVGYDGPKLIKGHKRQILVDTLGLLLQVVVSAVMRPKYSVDSQPAHSPELMPVEHIWEDIRKNHFYNHVYKSMDLVESRFAEVC